MKEPKNIYYKFKASKLKKPKRFKKLINKVLYRLLANEEIKPDSYKILIGLDGDDFILDKKTLRITFL